MTLLKTTIILLVVSFAISSQVEVSKGIATYPANMYRVYCQKDTILSGILTWNSVGNMTADLEVNIFQPWRDLLSISPPLRFATSNQENETFSTTINITGYYTIKPVLFYLFKNDSLTYNLLIDNAGTITEYQGSFFSNKNYINFIQVNMNTSINQLTITHTLSSRLDGQIIFDLKIEDQIYPNFFIIPANQTSHVFTMQNFNNANHFYLLAKLRMTKATAAEFVSANYLVTYDSQYENSLNSTSNFSSFIAGNHKQPANFFEIECKAGETLKGSANWQPEADLELFLYKEGQQFSQTPISSFNSMQKSKQSLEYQVQNSSIFFVSATTFQLYKKQKLPYTLNLACGSSKLSEQGTMYKRSSFNFLEFKNTKPGTCQLKLKYWYMNSNITSISPIMIYLQQNSKIVSLIGIQQPNSNNSEFDFLIKEGIYGIQFRSYLNVDRISNNRYELQYAQDECALQFLSYKTEVEEKVDEQTDNDNGVNIVAIIVPIACVLGVALIAAVSYLCWKKMHNRTINQNPNSYQNEDFQGNGVAKISQNDIILQPNFETFTN